MFGSRNEGSAVVRREENKRVLCDPQVPKKAQDFPNTVVDLPDSIPVPMGEKASVSSEVTTSGMDNTPDWLNSKKRGGKVQFPELIQDVTNYTTATLLSQRLG